MCKSKVPHCTTLPWKMGLGLGAKGAVADVVGAPHPVSPLLCPAAAVVDGPDTSSSLPEALVSPCRAAWKSQELSSPKGQTITNEGWHWWNYFITQWRSLICDLYGSSE